MSCAGIKLLFYRFHFNEQSLYDHVNGFSLIRLLYDDRSLWRSP